MIRVYDVSGYVNEFTGESIRYLNKFVNSNELKVLSELLETGYSINLDDIKKELSEVDLLYTEFSDVVEEFKDTVDKCSEIIIVSID